MLLQVMTELRHPNIVQFLGLCFLEGSTLPVLVMERLDSSLDDLLETSPGLPLALKLSLLTDVSRGLLYLHTHARPSCCTQRFVCPEHTPYIITGGQDQ